MIGASMCSRAKWSSCDGLPPSPWMGEGWGEGAHDRVASSTSDSSPKFTLSPTRIPALWPACQKALSGSRLRRSKSLLAPSRERGFKCMDSLR